MKKYMYEENMKKTWVFALDRTYNSHSLVIRTQWKLETLQLCGWLERNFRSNLEDNFTNAQ